jgi:hypothetical protein
VYLRYAVLSLVALFVISLLILKNYETWTRPIEAAPERSTAKKQEAKIENPSALRPQKVASPAQPYVAIAGKNIFSPERKDFPVLGTGSKPGGRPQVVLYGVTILGDYQTATITNPGRPLLRGERETMSLKIGDKIGGYKLVEIMSDRITLEADGDTFEVLLYDPSIPKKRIGVKTETKPATITSTQASPPGGVASTTGPASTPLPTSPVTPRPSAPAQQVAKPPPATPAIPTSPPTTTRPIRRGAPNTPPSSTPPQGTGGN